MRRRLSPLLALLLFTAVPAVGCGDDGDGASSTTDPADDAGPDDAGDEEDTSDQDAPAEDADDSDAPEDVGVADADADAPVADPCDDEVDPAAPGLCPTPSQDGVPEDGQDILAEVGAGEVRLGRVTDETGGVGGVEAACKRGDFVLVNAEARFCVDGPITSSALFFDGGRLIDAEPLGLTTPAGQSGRDRLGIISPFVSLQVSSADDFEIVRDGSDGQLAVLRVRGTLEPSSYLAGVVGPRLFGEYDLEVVTEYRLRPDRPVLELVTIATFAGEGRFTPLPGDIPFWGDTVDYVYLGRGQTAGPDNRSVLAWGDGVAYGLFYEGATSGGSIPGLDLPATPLQLPGTSLQTGESLAYRRHFVVGEQIADVIDAAAEALPDHPLAREMVEGQVTVTRGGEPAAGVTVGVFALDGQELGDEWYSGVTDGDGALRLRVEPGTYRVVATDASRHRAEVDLEVDDAAEADLELPLPGLVQLDVTRVMSAEGQSDPIASPARVVFTGPGGQRVRHFSLRGDDALELAAGTWSWEASLGMEYSAERGEFTLEADGEVTLTAQLEHVFDTPGFISGEFHQHSTASLDSEVSVEDRVLSNITEGVDFAVSSDHDVATDFGPAIEMLGATDLIASMPGTEVSPIYGHFGAYPVPEDRYKPGRGALPLSYRQEDGTIGRYGDGVELVEAMRQELQPDLIQINHPRDSTGYFDDFGFDPNAPIADADEGLSLDVDTMEVINGDECQQLVDWFSLFNQGQRIVGVGNSDTHSRSSPPGYPRNYIPAEVTSPDQIEDATIVEGVLSGDLVMAASAWIEFVDQPASNPDAIRPGRLIAGPEVTIDVRAVTPPWSEVNNLAVIKDGAFVDTMTIGAGEAEVVDFDGPITLDAGEADAWFVIMVWGDARASAVYPGKEVFAIANPFFIDADGDGQFTAPGVLPLSNDQIFFCQ